MTIFDRADQSPEAGEADLRAARAARRRLAREGMPPIIPDPVVARVLLPGEQALSVREADLVGTGTGLPQRGTLCLTTRRVLHVGAQVTSLDLCAIGEIGVAGRRLWVAPRGQGPLAFDLDVPNTLLVEARWAARRAA